MPGCSAINCSNSATKGFLMKHFPKDPLRRKLWAIEMKRDNWNPSDYSCLCEVHFAPEMWEKTRIDGKRALKSTAVPTIFSFSKPKKMRKAPKQRESITSRKQEIRTITSMKRHESSKHAKERVMKCDKCPHATTTLAHSLKRHQERHCRNRNRRKYNYECEECTFKSVDLTGFKNHNLISHPKKEILFCNICEFETTEDEDLREHAKTHMKSEPVDED